MFGLLRRFLARRTAWIACLLALAIIAGLWLWLPRHKPHAPPLEFREKLVGQLSKETVEETLRILPDFQDFACVLGSFPNGTGSDGSYRFARNLVPRLNRVRKLLALGRRSPSQFIPSLDRMLDESAQGLEAALKAKMEKYPSGTIKAPTEYHRKIVVAPAATYLLAELKSCSSLPLMAKVYRRPERKLPVNRIFLWYAMHLLVLDHPRGDLSLQAKRALDSYLEETRATVPRQSDVASHARRSARTGTTFKTGFGHTPRRSPGCAGSSRAE